ncbi:MAG: endolytic transglycosylase MltG [Peptococcaceae bacterium]|nr:endolytic transglycosylase MltG [Candidatus Syntrophopropionicum ammoniitolerans]
MGFFSGNKFKRANKTKLDKLFQYIVFPLVLAAVFLLYALSPISSKDKGREIVVNIPPNATARQVGDILKKDRLVRNSLTFTLYARYSGLDNRIKAGQYTLDDSLSTPALLKELVKGHQAEMSFTIPEGYTTMQIADLLMEKGLADRERFLQAASTADFNYPFIADLPKGEKRLEGYLFPDTYQVNGDDSEESIINIMLERFADVVKELDYQKKAQKNGVTLHEALTIASLVEREAKVDEERPLIAGVIYNRLRIDMLLQVDATVQYALGVTKPVLYYADLEVDSPYNTYKNYGLPPGPIAMPGRNSLLAAVQPVGTPYLYYVARPDGTHLFARTLAEHETNKEKCNL